MRKAYFYNDLIASRPGRLPLAEASRSPQLRLSEDRNQGVRRAAADAQVPLQRGRDRGDFHVRAGARRRPARQGIHLQSGAAGKRPRIDGERLLDRYNCVGCHMVEMPEIHYAVEPSEIKASTPCRRATTRRPAICCSSSSRHDKAKHGRDDQNDAGRAREDSARDAVPRLDHEPARAARAPEDQEYAYDLWETLDADGKTVFPATRMLVKKPRLTPGATVKDGYAVPPRGGDFAQWLVEKLSTVRRSQSLDWRGRWHRPPSIRRGPRCRRRGSTSSCGSRIVCGRPPCCGCRGST